MPENLWIKDWGRVFRLREAENHDQVTWTKFPVSRSSLSYRRLMSSSKGRAAYCVFIGCIRIVARGRTNGALTANGRALNAKDLADETGISVAVCKASFELLKSVEIGWLTDSAPVSNRSENGSAPVQEQSRAEQIRINTSASSKPDTPVPACLPAGQATVGELLSIIGIGGQALQMLAIAPTLTPEIVRREFQAAHGPKVKDPRRVLVRALCDLTGVVLPKKGGRPKAELIEALGGSMKINDLERMRMNRRGATG